MSEPAKAELLEQALALDVAHRLLDSVEGIEDEAPDAWAQELDRRLQAVEAGHYPGKSWADVRGRALSELPTRD